jgi:predicted nuclease of predicted toxin-antitoxin system
MKLKLDENLPETLAVTLGGLGHDVDTVRQEGLAGRDDGVIWAASTSEARFLITQDLDFSDITKFAPGTHPGILLLRLGSPGRLALIKRLESIFRTERVEEWQSCFVVVTDRKIRIRRPPP